MDDELQNNRNRFEGNFDDLLEKFNYNNNLYHLIDSVIDWFFQTVKSESLFFFLKKRYGKGFYKVKTINVTPDFFLEVDLSNNKDFFKELFTLAKNREDTYISLDNFLNQDIVLKEKLRKKGFNLILPFISRNKLIGGIIFQSNDELPPLNMNKLSKLSILIENAFLQRNLIIEKWEKGILLQVSKQLAGSDNPNEALNMLIDSLKKFVRYDAAAIFLVDYRDSTLRYEVIRGYDKEAFKKNPIKIGEGIVGNSIKNGKGIIVHDIRKDSRYINRRSSTQSEMVVPIISHKKILGAFNLESNKQHFFTKNQLETLKAFASQTAVVLENAKLLKDSIEKDQIDKELKIAAEIQKVLLPKRTIEVKGYLIEAFNLPSKTVGGDFFDLVNLTSNKIGMGIGDISGKGIPGAILMATLFSNFKAQVRISSKTHKVLQNLNNSFCEITDEDKYATFFYSVLNFSSNILHYSNAGHNPTILIRNNNDIELLNQGGPVLGFLRDINFKYDKKELQRNDLVFMYTDGITECMNKNNEEFGEARLIDFLKTNHRIQPEEIKHRLINEIEKFSQRKTFDDDVTFIILKKT